MVVQLNGQERAPARADRSRRRRRPAGEVEFAKAAATKQEIEFSVRNLQAGVAFTFAIDGIDVAAATTDRNGRAEVEIDVPLPGTTPSR